MGGQEHTLCGPLHRIDALHRLIGGIAMSRDGTLHEWPGWMALLHRVWIRASTLFLLLAASAGCGDAATAETGGSGGAATGNQGGGGTAGASTGETGGSGQGGSATAAGGTGGDPAGGAGGEATGTGGTGNGGNGTGGNGTGGNGGSGGADADAVCAAYCTLGSCVGNICTYPPGLYISLSKANTELPNGTFVENAVVQACAPASIQFQIDVLAIDGDCAIVKPIPLGNLGSQAFDAGAITIEGPTLGTLVLPSPGANQCEGGPLSIDGAFSPGEAISFDIAGGADVPPLSAVLTAPDEDTLTVPPINGGQPLVISWTPAPPPLWIQVVAPSAAGYLFCTPKLPGAITVSAALTAQIGGMAGDAAVQVTRGEMLTTDFGGTGPVSHLNVSHTRSIYVPYSP